MTDQPVYEERTVRTTNPNTNNDLDRADKQTTAANVVWYIYGFIAILLAFRFALKLFGANPNNGFVDFIYTISKPFTAPFDSIFGVTASKTGDVTSVFEPSILVAIAVYGVIAWGVVKLITINKRQ